ncbi:MAG: UDP-2,3-diacylglucosamine diphosphatase [Flavobacteriales bacterium]|nr:UDP-2,3-diacylglucosamine diphosphatase [Flavobacteriales bacterium]
MLAEQKIYFLSDFHLGVPNHAGSLAREKRIVHFLRLASEDAAEIHILGDIFDMWFEYKEVVPRGFVRLLGTLAELSDKGIPVHVHIGNHDMWMFDYLPKEAGVVLHREPIKREWNGKRFYIGHGDGLGPGDRGYKVIKRVFRNPLMQWCFARLHPNLGLGIANYWSGRSRNKNYENDKKYLGPEKEWLAQHSRGVLQQEHFDYFVFGHRHLPMELPLSGNGAAGAKSSLSSGSTSPEPRLASKYINLGDWMSWYTYAVFDGQELRLKRRVSDGPLTDDTRLTGAPPFTS